MSVSVAVIALNEGKNIEACLESVRWADEIVVVDSGSTDATVEKARRFTGKIDRVPFRDFASQKNEALARATKEWVFFLDADERVPEDLAAEIRRVVSGPAERAYAVGRVTYFWGKRLRFSGTQEDFPVRLFPRTEACFEQPVHERVVTGLPLTRLKSRLLHFTTRDWPHYRSKLDQYIPLEIETMKQKGRRPCVADLVLRPPAVFVSLYLLRLGLLDGLAGLKYAVLSSYYCFLKYRRFLACCP